MHKPAVCTFHKLHKLDLAACENPQKPEHPREMLITTLAPDFTSPNPALQE